MSDDNLREVVGAFHDVQALQNTAQALMSSGFDRSHLSLIAAEATVREKFGSQVMRVDQLEDDPATPRIEYADPSDVAIGQGALMGGLFYLGAMVGTGAVLISGGALLPAFAAAAAGGAGGGALGALFASKLKTEVANKIADEVERGGLILWVRTLDPENDALAEGIMQQNGAYEVHMHGSGLGPSGAATE
jgi:hypothetical protein